MFASNSAAMWLHASFCSHSASGRQADARQALFQAAAPLTGWPCGVAESDASIQGTIQISPRQGAADPNVAYAVLSRPMPDYALQYEFSR